MSNGSLERRRWPFGTEKIIKIRQMSVFNNIDKSSIHAGLRDFDKKCYKHRSEATLQYTLTDQNAPKCSVLKSWTGGLCVYTFLLIFLALSALCAAHNKRFDLD